MGQHLPGITQTTSPLSKQEGHLLPGTGYSSISKSYTSPIVSTLGMVEIGSLKFTNKSIFRLSLTRLRCVNIKKTKAEIAINIHIINIAEIIILIILFLLICDCPFNPVPHIIHKNDCSSNHDKNLTKDTDSTTIGIELCNIPQISEH